MACVSRWPSRFLLQRRRHARSTPSAFAATRLPSTSPPFSIIGAAAASHQVSTARTDGIVRRVEVHAREGTQRGSVVPRSPTRRRRSARPPDRRATIASCSSDLQPTGRSRIATGHAVDRRSLTKGRRATTADVFRVHARYQLPSLPCFMEFLRHRQLAAAFSLRNRRFKVDSFTLLSGHRRRHSPGSRARADQSVRGQGQHHVSRRRSAGMGGLRVV